MREKPIRIAVAGCGRVAQHYRKILDSGVVSGWKIVGACDLVRDKAESLSRHWGCKAFSGLEEMLRETRPDLALVLTPSGLHHLHARIAMEHGAHVLVEKPLALLPSDARALVAFAGEKGLLCGVAFQNRLNPAIKCLRRAVTARRFGKITTATMRLRSLIRTQTTRP